MISTTDHGPVSDQVDDDVAVPGCSPLRRDVGDKEDGLDMMNINMTRPYFHVKLSCLYTLPALYYVTVELTSGSSALTWKMGALTTLPTSVQYGLERE